MPKKLTLLMAVLLLVVLMAGCGGGRSGEVIVAPPVYGDGEDADEVTRFAAISVGSQLGATAGGSGSFSVSASAPEAMAQLINQKRCEVGLTPIVVNDLLNRAAETHSLYLAGDATLNSDGNPGTMISNAGYSRGGYWYLLMCGGYSNEAQTYFDNWWNYGSDTQNIILGNYQEIGVGLITDETDFSYISLLMTTPASPITPPSCSDLGF